MSTTADITNTAVFERPKSLVRSYCRTHQYLMRDGITHGCASTEPPSPGCDLGPSVRHCAPKYSVTTPRLGGLRCCRDGGQR
jgi:hypothetical protein